MLNRVENDQLLWNSTVYLNGQYLPLKQAKISVCDRGFLFGDGIYEVIKAYHGKPFGLHAHLKRLSESLSAIHLPLSMSAKDWEHIIESLIAKNPISPQQVIYLQVTRGADHPARNHRLPSGTITPTVFIQTFPFKQHSLSKIQKGFKAVTAEDTRRLQCHIKAINLLPNILLMQQAYEAGAIEIILLRQGKAIEGASSNLFIVESGTIITPPLKPYMLGGITRHMILDLAKTHGIPYAERTITQSALQHADEIWITSSLREIFPITQLDGKPVGNGHVGKFWHKIHALYQSRLPA